MADQEYRSDSGAVMTKENYELVQAAKERQDKFPFLPNLVDAGESHPQIGMGDTKQHEGNEPGVNSDEGEVFKVPADVVVQAGEEAVGMEPTKLHQGEQHVLGSTVYSDGKPGANGIFFADKPTDAVPAVDEDSPGGKAAKKAKQDAKDMGQNPSAEEALKGVSSE